MLKEATIRFCLFDESHFSVICAFSYVKTECIEINWLRKYRERSEAAKLLFQ